MTADILRPEPGTRTVFRWRKWDGGPHWVHDCIYLGHDRWGEWFGQPEGTRSFRPGREVLTRAASVTLVPPSGDHALTVNVAPPASSRIYIDLAWDVRWSDTEAGVPTGIDMDLDVVRAVDGRGTWIDDRDEWDEHRVAYGYPAEIVTHLEALAIELECKVRDRVAPYDDDTANAWLARLAALAGAGPAARADA